MAERRRPRKPLFDPSVEQAYREKYAKGADPDEIGKEFLPAEPEAPAAAVVPQSGPISYAKPISRVSGGGVSDLMASPAGSEWDKRKSELDQVFSNTDSGEGSAITSLEGPGINKVHPTSPIKAVYISERHPQVPIHPEKIYEDWRATQPKIAVGSTTPGTRPRPGSVALTGAGELPRWHELSGEQQVNWQQNHPEGKKLTAAAIKFAKENPESGMSSNEDTQRSELRHLRAKVRNYVAEPNRDPSTFKTGEVAPLHQRFVEHGELLTGNYMFGGTDANSPRENLDQTPEVSLGRAWVSNVTSRPEIGMALHNDPSHHENMKNAVNSLMQEHASTVGGAAYGSEVAKHGRLALEAVARSARAHGLGMKTVATTNMSQAVRHIHDLSKAVQGAQMSAGIKVASPMHPAVMSAGKAYGDYNASVANVKGLPE